MRDEGRESTFASYARRLDAFVECKDEYMDKIKELFNLVVNGIIPTVVIISICESPALSK